MIVKSSALESAVNEMSPDDLERWAIKRLRGDDRTPLLYYGKEHEEPEEAVAAALTLSEPALTPEKRVALVRALQKIFFEIQHPLINQGVEGADLSTLRRWAKVVERAKPQELTAHASLLLHACEKAGDVISEELPQVAAASAAFPNLDEDDLSIWKRLLKKPNTAALAFRRLLKTSPFPESAKNWVQLLEMRSRGATPANVRLLLPPLLRKADDPEAKAFSLLIESIIRANLDEFAIKELESSKNESVQRLIAKLEEFSDPSLKHNTLPPKAKKFNNRPKNLPIRQSHAMNTPLKPGATITVEFGITKPSSYRYKKPKKTQTTYISK